MYKYLVCLNCSCDNIMDDKHTIDGDDMLAPSSFTTVKACLAATAKSICNETELSPNDTVPPKNERKAAGPR